MKRGMLYKKTAKRHKTVKGIEIIVDRKCTQFDNSFLWNSMISIDASQPILDRYGIKISEFEQSGSGSIYITFNECVKIRISDHNLPKFSIMPYGVVHEYITCNGNIILNNSVVARIKKYIGNEFTKCNNLSPLCGMYDIFKSH